MFCLMTYSLTKFLFVNATGIKKVNREKNATTCSRRSRRRANIEVRTRSTSTEADRNVFNKR